MSDKYNMAEAVARGAAKLDETIPDWFQRVHGAMTRGYFYMSRWDACIAGTLELVSYNAQDQVVITFNGEQLVGYDEALEYGFVTTGEKHGDWDTLESYWRGEITKRLERAGIASRLGH
jgi:hypothetical protein